MGAEQQRFTDEDLARQTQGGSMSAFEELVSRYERRVYGFAANFCHNPADAREVTQDTFVKAYRAIGQFKSRHAFSSWLFTIARRKCIDHHRANPPREKEIAPVLTAPGDPAVLLEEQEERENIWRIARRILPDAQFQTIWLRYAEDLSIKQVARVLGKSGPHVRVLLFRARQTLGRALKPGELQVRGFPARLPEDKPTGLLVSRQKGSL